MAKADCEARINCTADKVEDHLSYNQLNSVIKNH